MEKSFIMKEEIKQKEHQLDAAFEIFMGAESVSEVHSSMAKMLEMCLPNKRYGLFLFQKYGERFLPVPDCGLEVAELGLEEFLKEMATYLNTTSNVGTFHKGILIPQYNGRQNVGVLYVLGGLSRDEQHKMEELSRLWVMGKERVELRANNHRLARDLGRSLHHLSVVKSVAESVGQAQGLHHLLSLILKVAVSTVDATKGYILLVDDKNESLKMSVCWDGEGVRADSEIDNMSLQEGICGKVLQDRKPLLVKNLMMAETDFFGLAAGAHSVMCVPLVTEGEAFGVIYVTSEKEEEGFLSDELDVFSILASHASAVIEQARLHSLAVMDPLTGLYTRRYYHQRMTEEMRRSHRGNYALSLLMVDIDFFKKFNDTYGHEMGDKVLVQVARTLLNNVRSDQDAVVRYGGEEFVVVLPECSLEEALKLGERMRSAVEATEVYWEGEFRSVTVSVGVASYPQGTPNPEDLFTLADQALYTSKAQGRNSVVASS